jgi:hypothetical protein
MEIDDHITNFLQVSITLQLIQGEFIHLLNNIL